MVDALVKTQLVLVGSYVLIYLIATFLRAIRYRLLLQMSGETSVPLVRQMFLVTGIRNMVVDMFPSRLGELGYIGC